MKKMYNAPEMELILLASEDVCTLSDVSGLKDGGEEATPSAKKWSELWGGNDEIEF